MVESLNHSVAWIKLHLNKLKMNEELLKLYKSKWQNLSSKLNHIVENDEYQQKPTNPLLISVDEKYITSDIKVLILGQETNDWGHHFTNNITETLQIYDDFYNSGYALNTYGGHFWNGINRFIFLMQQKFPDKNINYIWNNVVKIGAAGSNQNHPMDYIYAIESENFQVLEKEIEILKPDVILFISGPYYDYNIINTLKDVEFKEIDSTFTVKQLAKLEYKNHNNIFRTYHPNYLWRNNINLYFEKIINNIETE